MRVFAVLLALLANAECWTLAPGTAPNALRVPVSAATSPVMIFAGGRARSAASVVIGFAEASIVMNIAQKVARM